MDQHDRAASPDADPPGGGSPGGAETRVAVTSADEGGPAGAGSRGWVAGAAALVVLALLAVWSAAAVGTPEPVGAGAAADRFSAARAYEHVQVIAARPHVAGSAANQDVRDHLLATLRSRGVQVETQTTVGGGTEDSRTDLAGVENVVGLIPGTASTGRIILVAHYDSVQVGPGGNDDAAGTAAILETVRALTSGPRLRNDVVIALTDAEEACLCGARAFAQDHRWAADGGVVLNLEARGRSGPPILFETSRGDARLVGAYAKAAEHRVGTSFAVEVYRLLPNDTDFTAFRETGRFTGLNAAYVDGWAAYHTPGDTPARLDRGTLQAHGDNLLGLTRELGGRDLTADRQRAAHDATYFPVLGWLPHYPGWLVWPLAGLAAAAVVGLGWLARRRGLASWPRLLAGTLLAAVPVVVAAVAAQGLSALLVAVRPGYAGMLDPWRPGWFRWAVVALVAFVVLGWYGLARRLGPTAVAVGALALLAILGLGFAAAVPGGSYLAALPALAGALAGSAALTLRSPGSAGRSPGSAGPRPSGSAAPAGSAGPPPPGAGLRPPWLHVLALCVGGAVAVLVLVPPAVLFFPAMGLATAAAGALVASLLGLTLLPLLELLPARRTAVAGTLVAALACTAAGLTVDRFDAEHPAPTQLMYALDADTGRARWVSAEADPAGWTRGFVTGREDLSEEFPLVGDGAIADEADIATGPAEPAALPPAELTALPPTDLGPDVDPEVPGATRTSRFRIQPRRPVRLVELRVTGVPVLRATVAGRSVPTRSGAPLHVLFHAPPVAGLDVELVLGGPGGTVRVTDGSDGLGELPGFRPRPAGVGIAGSHTSELVLVAKSHSLP